MCCCFIGWFYSPILVLHVYTCRLRTDHNVDGTIGVMKHWCFKTRKVYKSVDCRASNKWEYPTSQPYSVSVQRSKKKARLRQEALEAALTAGADYLLVSFFY